MDNPDTYSIGHKIQNEYIQNKITQHWKLKRCATRSSKNRSGSMFLQKVGSYCFLADNCHISHIVKREKRTVNIETQQEKHKGNPEQKNDRTTWILTIIMIEIRSARMKLKLCYDVIRQ